MSGGLALESDVTAMGVRRIFFNGGNVNILLILVRLLTM